MDTATQANQLRGFVESLKLADNISKSQLDMLLSKLDLLIETLVDDDYPDMTNTAKPFTPSTTFIEEEPDDLPF